MHLTKPKVLNLSVSVYRSPAKETRFQHMPEKRKINHYVSELFYIKIFSVKV